MSFPNFTDNYFFLKRKHFKRFDNKKRFFQRACVCVRAQILQVLGRQMNINECCCQLMSLAIEGEKTREAERKTMRGEIRAFGSPRQKEREERRARGEASGNSISIHMACSSGED